MSLRWSAILFVIFLGGCGGDSLPENANGKQLFDHYCAGCHKGSGSGNFFKGIPANASTKMTQAEIVSLILNGRSDVKGMPVYSDMSRRDAILISKYVKDQLGR